MICLRCGYCCRWAFSVQIVVDPAKGYTKGNLTGYIGSYTRKAKPCRYLRGSKPRHFSCAVHDEPWYEKTKCYEFKQNGDSPNTPCRIGAYALTHPRSRPIDWRLIYYLLQWSTTEDKPKLAKNYELYVKWFERQMSLRPKRTVLP